ncbi:AAA family ATPase [Acanthopleuribacter pedis]
MIGTLTVRSFKSLKDVQIELGNINVFIGANGSGKSNILEAVGVLSAAVSGRVDDEALLRRGVRAGVARLYKSAFADARMLPHIYFKAEDETAAYAVSLLNNLDNPLPAWRYKTEEFIQDATSVASRGPKSSDNKEYGLAPAIIVDLKPSEALPRLITALRDFGIYAPTTPVLRGLQPDMQARRPVGLAGGGLADAVKTMRTRLSEENERESDEDLVDFWDDLTGLIDWMEDVDTATSAASILSPSVPRQQRIIRFFDRFMIKGRNSLTAYDASEGALSVLLYGILAAHPEVAPILAIDNMDQALNPRLVKRLMNLLCDWLPNHRPDRQFLLTAHNPSVLDGLNLSDDRVRLFAVDRNNTGHTTVKRVQVDAKLHAMAEEKGWPLSRLWVMGYLGGVPNV